MLLSTFHPKYLGILLDCTLSYKTTKLKSRNNIVDKLAGTTWGVDAQTLQGTSLTCGYSMTEYCSSVWLNRLHVGKANVALNQTMRKSEPPSGLSLPKGNLSSIKHNTTLDTIVGLKKKPSTTLLSTRLVKPNYLALCRPTYVYEGYTTLLTVTIDNLKLLNFVFNGKKIRSLPKQNS